MRATRAYIASLGTTGLLLAFSASLLVVVGTLFAFNAWPGTEIRDAVQSVIVGEEEEPFQVSGPEQVALDAAPAAAAVAAAPTGPAGGAGGGGGTGGGGGGDGTPAPGPGGGGIEQTGQVPTGGTETGGGGGGGVSPISPGGVDTGDSTNPLADTTEGLTRDVGDTVGQVSPQLGDTVTQTGQDLSNIVRDLPDVKVDNQGISIGD